MTGDTPVFGGSLGGDMAGALALWDETHAAPTAFTPRHHSFRRPALSPGSIRGASGNHGPDPEAQKAPAERPSSAGAGASSGYDPGNRGNPRGEAGATSGGGTASPLRAPACSLPAAPAAIPPPLASASLGSHWDRTEIAAIGVSAPPRVVRRTADGGIALDHGERCISGVWSQEALEAAAVAVLSGESRMRTAPVMLDVLAMGVITLVAERKLHRERGPLPSSPASGRGDIS